MTSHSALTQPTARNPRSTWAAWSGRTATLRPRPSQPWRGRLGPFLAWGLALAVALLSFYVHLLQEHVQRSETLRQAQRDATLQAARAKAAPSPAAALQGQRKVQHRP